jgi:hypothetical protein
MRYSAKDLGSSEKGDWGWTLGVWSMFSGVGLVGDSQEIEGRRNTNWG